MKLLRNIYRCRVNDLDIPSLPMTEEESSCLGAGGVS